MLLNILKLVEKNNDLACCAFVCLNWWNCIAENKELFYRVCEEAINWRPLKVYWEMIDGKYGYQVLNHIATEYFIESGIEIYPKESVLKMLKELEEISKDIDWVEEIGKNDEEGKKIKKKNKKKDKKKSKKKVHMEEEDIDNDIEKEEENIDNEKEKEEYAMKSYVGDNSSNTNTYLHVCSGKDGQGHIALQIFRTRGLVCGYYNGISFVSCHDFCFSNLDKNPNDRNCKVSKQEMEDPQLLISMLLKMAIEYLYTFKK